MQEISTLEQTLEPQGNMLAIILQLYQLDTVKELATRQWLVDHIDNIMFSQNLQHFHFSFLDFLYEEMQPNINVLGFLMIG